MSLEARESGNHSSDVCCLVKNTKGGFILHFLVKTSARCFYLQNKKTENDFPGYKEHERFKLTSSFSIRTDFHTGSLLK